MTQELTRFLTLVSWSEGTSTSPVTLCDGYDVIVSGVAGPEAFTDFSAHPFLNRPAKLIRAANDTHPVLYSTASGRYQILLGIWKSYQAELKLPDFSPASQDAVAVELMKERGAIAQLQAGKVARAIQLCSGIWASLPGNIYGQGGHTLDVLMDQWERLCPSAATVSS